MWCNCDPIPVRTLWDTGADISAITPRLFAKLGTVTSVGHETARVANLASMDSDVFYISILIGEIPLEIPVIVLSPRDDKEDYNEDMLIGFDIINHGTFKTELIDNHTRLTFEYTPKDN